MIRINLLPVKKARKREAGQRQLLYMAGGVVAVGIAIFFVHMTATNELEQIQRDNRSLQADIERLKAELGDYDKIKAQREELLRQRKTIQSLQAGRTGPVYLMREVSEILTPNKGPTFDRVTYEERLRRDPNIGFNSSWDTRRVWLDSFEETAQRVKIRGAAKSNEDVAEFLKRLQLSVFFNEVVPEATNQVAAAGPIAVKHVSFSLSATVAY